jgi:hypothetical protein
VECHIEVYSCTEPRYGRRGTIQKRKVNGGAYLVYLDEPYKDEPYKGDRVRLVLSENIRPLSALDRLAEINDEKG